MEVGDETHDLWNKHLSKMKEIVTEFANDNNISLSETDIYELSIYNIGPGGTEFDNYMKRLSEESGEDIEFEQSMFYHRISLLTDDEYRKNNLIEVQPNSSEDVQENQENQGDD